jgi:replicative DNA helicase
MQPDIVFIDYLTLMGTSGEDWRATAKLSGELQSVFQRYQIPGVAMSQVNRLGVGKEPPGAENLSQADAIGQDADLVVTMAQKSKSVMKLKIAKFRHGPTGAHWFCEFAPGTGKYEEITGDQADDLIQHDLDVP